MRLDGKTVLITGAGSGIGRALAVEAAARGARLVLSGRREEPLRETAGLLPADADWVIVPGDIGEASVRSELVLTAERKLAGLDVLVNNAGTQSVGPLAGQDDEALAAMVRTNLYAPAALTRDFLPQLRRNRGRVVNIGSMFGDIGHPLFAFYSATKFGLRGLSDALRRELAPLGIGVTYAAPRATRTESAPGFSHLIEPFGMKLDAPEQVARAIWGAVGRDARSVYPLGMERMFVLIQRLMPSVIDGGLKRQLRRADDAGAVIDAGTRVPE